MNAARTCPECGAELREGALEGLCPDCLGKLALGSEGTGQRPEVRGQRTGEIPAEVGRDVPIAPRRREDTPPYQSFGDYELLSEIAHGGMGVVFKARQVSLNRIVAVKMIRADRLAREDDIRRFRTEAQAAAQLQHPNIVAIHEVGEVDGQHFYSMDYVAGRSLSQTAREKPLLPKQAARYVQKIAEAIHYAHQRGILHRDLKPSNVLVDENDEPRVTDFGLAKLMAGDSEMTMSGTVMGSPSYMPPEQASGRSREVTVRSDVYSLGAILYDVLCGRPPFRAETTLETLRQVVEMEPVLPRVLNPRAPRDLETIVLKCLQKEPGKRYASAQELADELARFQRGEPIQARPIGPTARLWRWCRRKPALAVSISAAVLLLVAGILGVLLALERAVRGEVTAQRNLYDADMNLAMHAHNEGNLGRVLELLEKHRPASGQTDLRGWEWRYLSHQTRSDELFRLGSHSNIVRTVAFSPDGKTVASGSHDHSVEIWDVSGRRELKRLDHPDIVGDLFYTSDGSQLATACMDGILRIWDTANWSAIPVFTNLPYMLSVAYAPKLGLVAAAEWGSVTLWDLKARRVLRQWPTRGYAALPIGLAFSPDEAILAFHRKAGEIVLWDVSNQRELGSLLGHISEVFAGEVLALAFSPDGQTLVSGGQDKVPRVWDVATRRARTNLTEFSSWVGCLRFSPDGKVLVAASADQQIKLWETAGWEEIATLKGHPNEVWSIAFSPDGSQLASGGKDGTVRVWSANVHRRGKAEEMRFSPYIDSSYLSPDGTAVATKVGSGSNITHRFWRTDQWREVPVQNSFPTKTAVVAVSPGGEEFALAVSGGGLLLWDSAGHLPPSLRSGGARVRRGAFSSDGEILAVARAGGMIELWNVRENTLIAQLDEQAGSGGLEISPNRRFLAASKGDGSIAIWDLANLKRLAAFRPHKDVAEGLAFSPNSQTLASASRDGTVKLWLVGSQQPLAVLSGHLNAFTSVTFSRDGRRLFAGTGNGPILLWDLTIDPPQELGRLKGHKGGASSVLDLGFLPDNETLVSVSETEIRAWRTSPFDGSDWKSHPLLSR